MRAAAVVAALAVTSIAASARADGPLRQEVAPAEADRAPTVFARDGYPLAGYQGGRFYLRDEDDRFLLSPGMLLQVDGKGAFGKDVRDVTGEPGAPLRSQMLVRRARFELAGHVVRRVGFYFTYDAASSKLNHAIVDVEAHEYLHLSVGQQQVPFTMDNRTPVGGLTWMELPLAVRFAQPSPFDLGAMAWAPFPKKLGGYEVGVFGGDGLNRPSVDDRADFAGRVYVNPLATTHSLASDIRIGFSGTVGERRARDVTYDVTPLTTQGGYAFFGGTRADGGRTAHILPSGLQAGYAGELRIPISRFDFRFEFMGIRRDTREAIDGFQATNSERFGRIRGTAWYAHLSFWAWGDPRVGRVPGHFRIPQVRFPKGSPRELLQGIELSARVESISATYDANSRARLATEAPFSESIKAIAVGGGATWHATPHAKLMLNYTYTRFPDAGEPGSGTRAPGFYVADFSSKDIHEVAARAQVAF